MATLISLRAAPIRCSRLASSASHRSGYITARSRSSSTSRTPPPPPYNVLFCGTDSFAATILQGLHRSPSIAHSITVAVPAEQKYHSATREGSRRRAAASAVTQPPVLDYAHRHDLPAIRVTDFKNDDLPLPGSSSSPLLVTASFGKLVPAWLLDLYPSPSLTLNVHPSLLPDLRGAAPIQWAIARGYEKTGVSIQQLGRETFDQGDLLAQEKVDLPIEGGRRVAYAEVERLLAQASSELLVDTLASLPQRHATADPQDGAKATLAPKIKAEHGRVDWQAMSAKEIEARHRGFGHQINLYTYLHRSDSPQAVRTLLLDVHHVPSTASLPERAKVLRDNPQYPSGTAVFAPTSPHAGEREIIYVKTTVRQEGEVGLLAVRRLMCAGKAEQATLRDWWRGYGRPKGEMPLLRFVSHDNGGIAAATSSGQSRILQAQSQQQRSRTTAATASIASSSSATLIGQQMRAFSSRATHCSHFSKQRAYSTRPPQPPPSPSSFNTASMTPNTSPTAPPPRPPRRRGTIYKLTGDGLSWSQLHPVQKVFRTGEKGGQLTVVVLGTALTAAVLWALLSDMFAPNSPSVIFKDACGRVERCEEIYHHLLPPLRFHLHPTPSFTSSPNPTNPIIGALGGGSGSTHRGSHLPPTRVVREERTGKEVLHMRFYIEARDKERDWTYAEKGRQGVRDGWEWMRTQLGEAWESLTEGVEGGAQQQHHHEEMSRAEAEARGQASASSSGPSVVGRILSSLSFLPASKSSSSSGKANRREPGTFATGEAHVEMVRNVGSNDTWQYRRIMVDVPKSGTLGATRVWVVKREGEVVR